MRHSAMLARLAPPGVFLWVSLAIAVAASLPLGGISPARAQPASHPPYMPTRDVKVVYEVQPQGAPAPQRIIVWFANAGDLMRIDSPDSQSGAIQGETILDRDRKLLTIVMNSAHVYMQVAQRQALRSPFLFDASMSFKPAGTGAVAGLTCMRWTITASAGHATACITGDGVVLSEAGVDSQGASGTLTAQQVIYGTVPAAAFQPPDGYSRVAHPEGPGPYERQGDPGGGPGGASGPALGPP